MWRRFLCASVVLLGGAAMACEQKKAPAPEGVAEAPAAATTQAAALAVEGMALLWDLGEPKAPPDNPTTPEKVALGHQLFFDKRLSVDGSLACYSCHQNEDGGGGRDALAIGPGGKQLPRHSPVIWNVGYLPRFYWDGRSDSLEAQMKAAWAGGNLGVGEQNLEKKAREIAKVSGYKAAFAQVFPKEGVTPDTIAKAVAAYERTLVCKDTAYDRYAQGNKSALTREQLVGLDLFLGKAQCSICHTPPHFSSAYVVPTGSYYNTGMGLQGIERDKADVGRFKVTQAEADFAAFKVPTLRNVARTAPYFHNGSVKTLREAVQFMASGGYANPNRTPLLSDKKLSSGEISSLVHFLEALNCERQQEEPQLPE